MLLVTTKLYGLLLIHNTDLHGLLRKKDRIQVSGHHDL